MGCCEAAHQPFGCFSDELLATHCGISLRDHVPNVDILNRCNTCLWSLSCKAKTQMARVIHVFRVPNDRLPREAIV